MIKIMIYDKIDNLLKMNTNKCIKLKMTWNTEVV